jgi:hypothetical protein
MQLNFDEWTSVTHSIENLNLDSNSLLPEFLLSECFNTWCNECMLLITS